MRLTRRVAITIALVCGALAALLSIVYLNGMQRERKTPAPPEPVEVAVPRVSIPARSIITGDMLTTSKVEPAKLPKLAVKGPEEIIGYVAVESLQPNMPISRSQVMARGAAFGLSGIVPQGMRAVTVAVDPIIGVAGLLKAGDRVDVIAAFEVDDAVIARTILQDVELLALGSQTSAATAAKDKQVATDEAATEGSAEAEATKARTVDYPNATIAVTPEDAQRLILADQQGELRLTLRPVGEHDFVPVAVQDMSSVGGPEYTRLQAEARKKGKPDAEEKKANEPPPWTQGQWGPQGPTPTPATPAAPEKPKKPEVEIIRGDQTTKVVP